MPAHSLLLLIAALLASAIPSRIAAQAPALRDQVRMWREAREAQILTELHEWLSLPNVASNRDDIRRNADALVAMLARRGIAARRLEVEGSPPAVYGELPAPGATRTVMLYAHYDGQPVDRAKWASDPFVPMLRSRSLAEGGVPIPYPAAGERVDPEARLYARSASDDKSPIVAMLAALDALQALGVPRSVNLKFFFEGEEEAGSEHLRAMLGTHAELLRADGWLMFDGPVHQTRRPQVSFGVRGVQGLNLTVYGPVRPLHSGHYGNWAPNPNLLLAHLIASLRDPEGRILIPGFYDDVRPVTAAERAAIATIPRPDEQLRAELGLARTEAENAPLNDRIMLPALNVGGLAGGRTGEGGANLIGTESSAYIDFRLVPDQTPARLRTLVEDHLVRQGWHIVRAAPDSLLRQRHARLVKVDWGDAGYPALRTPPDHPFSRQLVRTIEATLGAPIIQQPTSGGSLPLYHFAEVLRTPLVSVPLVNHDNNQHGENENLRLRNLWDGIELIAGLVARLGQDWPAGR